MIAPRKAKELTHLMMDDPELKQAFYNLVSEADRLIEKKSLAALQAFLTRGDVDLRLLSHGDVTDAFNAFYREARLAGQFVRMW
jgi:hypothetical protein